MHKIIVVDDEEHVRFLYGEELTDEGYEVIKRASCFRTLEIISYYQPEVIILDIKMVDESGLDLLWDIRDKSLDIIVILCTAYDDYKHDSRSLLADYYIIKSFDLTELKETLARALESKMGQDTDGLTDGQRNFTNEKIISAEHRCFLWEHLIDYVLSFLDDRIDCYLLMDGIKEQTVIGEALYQIHAYPEIANDIAEKEMAELQHIVERYLFEIKFAFWSLTRSFFVDKIFDFDLYSDFPWRYLTDSKFFNLARNLEKIELDTFMAKNTDDRLLKRPNLPKYFITEFYHHYKFRRYCRLNYKAKDALLTKIHAGQDITDCNKILSDCQIRYCLFRYSSIDY